MWAPRGWNYAERYFYFASSPQQIVASCERGWELRWMLLLFLKISPFNFPHKSLHHVSTAWVGGLQPKAGVKWQGGETDEEADYLFSQIQLESETHKLQMESKAQMFQTESETQIFQLESETQIFQKESETQIWTQGNFPFQGKSDKNISSTTNNNSKVIFLELLMDGTKWAVKVKILIVKVKAKIHIVKV